ncbi:putative patatin-like phospholipase domain-containing protein [Eutypa lata UCREL1]|uniref:Putative patatin-like phospholipase domain-containing protein n=1 Tax=Eutypa lata (strain UCR-EL1) TaxID=1287681 RepID=M7SDV7_EUTLA|nr:putative patatin-like phospholipase domain-containing protein [Eutypa lata UCREL1]
MRATSSYRDWIKAAKELDKFLGNEQWKEENEFAYYDWKTVRRVWEQMREFRKAAEAYDMRISGAPGYKNGDAKETDGKKAAENLKALIEACVKNNFVGVENPRLYSQTYYGTKNLVQNFVDEVERGVRFLVHTELFSVEEKRTLFKRLHANFGRSALCLSGGATLAYYHFGVIKALLEADLVPDIITGTSGGALIAALVATRTNDELKQLLIPALSHKIKPCSEPITTWFPRWWKTGARFDSLTWARQYCVIWSAVIASAAVPGILNPVVLMMKNKDGSLSPYSFGHKWKDGSLRTDIPIKALNLHFNVNFTIVSQVNPHISLFFFSSRGTVGSPVTHRRGRGWRGGFLGSATEQYIKLDLTKWLKVLKHLELLPRPMGQDWSQLWLQQFGGTITIWPQGRPSDLAHILSDPGMDRLARMIHEGQQSAFPKLKFVSNRLRVERLIEQGRRATLGAGVRRGSIESIIDEDDLRKLLRGTSSQTDEDETTTDGEAEEGDVDADEEAVIEDGDFEDAVDDDDDNEVAVVLAEEDEGGRLKKD